MEASASASAAAAADGSNFPIYISSDEDDGRALLAGSYSPEEIQIQQAILLSLDSSRGPDHSSAYSCGSPSASSSRPSGVSTSEEPPSLPDRKGKCKLSLEEDGPCDPTKKRRKGSRFKCSICLEKVQVSEQFLVSFCAHAFCKSCVGRYVAAKVGENAAVIRCPDPECQEGFVEMDPCRDIIPPELFDRWSVSLCELALGKKKYYCPFKDCSALLIYDNDSTEKKIRETECPHCHRMFCARCRVPWHDGIKCKEFRKLGDDEKEEEGLMFKTLAEKKKWQRCPNCKMFVSRINGCLQIKCRCKQYFCYHCAAPMKKDSHYCKNCKR